MNKLWTFESKRKSYLEVAPFLILYLFTLGLNVSVNHLALKVLAVLPGPFEGMAGTVLAFLLATSVAMTVNFLGQKVWVFREEEA